MSRPELATFPPPQRCQEKRDGGTATAEIIITSLSPHFISLPQRKEGKGEREERETPGPTANPQSPVPVRAWRGAQFADSVLQSISPNGPSFDIVGESPTSLCCGSGVSKRGARGFLPVKKSRNWPHDYFFFGQEQKGRDGGGKR